jgi:hypothetical protein
MDKKCCIKCNDSGFGVKACAFDDCFCHTDITVLEDIADKKRYKFKGDAPCQYCGREYNPVWYTDNVFWNEVMNDDIKGSESRGQILCPLCFMSFAEKKFDCAWRIIPDWKWVKKGSKEFNERFAVYDATSKLQ